MKHVQARVVGRPGTVSPQAFAGDHTTSDAKAYEGFPSDREIVTHPLREYTRGEVHTDGVESLSSLPVRATPGRLHRFSSNHLNRCVQAFAPRQNSHERNAPDIKAIVGDRMRDKRFRFRELVGDNGSPNGARCK